MRESEFTRSINKYLPSDIYRWKINDRFTAGIPDSWYSGAVRDLWVEYKWDKTPPKHYRSKLTARQTAWLKQQYNLGRNVAVIYGTPKFSVILEHRDWEDEWNWDELITLDRKGVAKWIENYVNGLI